MFGKTMSPWITLPVSERLQSHFSTAQVRHHMEAEKVDAAWKATRHSLIHLFQESSRFEAILTETFVSVLTPLPYPDLNMAVLGRSSPDSRLLTHFLETCRQKYTPSLCLVVGETPECHTAGLQPVGSIPLMQLRNQTTPIAASHIHCLPAANDCNIREANHVVAAAFDIPAEAIESAFGGNIPQHPGLRVYVAKQADSVVSSLRISRIGSTAVIWCMATSPDSQRQGIGPQLLQTAITSERQTGADNFLWLATPAGMRLYEKLEFITLGEASAFLLTT